MKVQNRAIQPYFSGVGLIDAGDVLDQRRLAGAVVADQRQHFARLQREICPGKRAHRSEALAKTGDFKQRRHVRPSKR
jgi:hypothetical protein